MTENGNINQDSICPKKGCGKKIGDDGHGCDIIPPGDYNGDGRKLGDHTIEKCYSQSFSDNPFFIYSTALR